MPLLKQPIAQWCGFPPEDAGGVAVNALGEYFELVSHLLRALVEAAGQDPSC